MLALGESNHHARPVRVRVSAQGTVPTIGRQIDLTRLPRTSGAWQEVLAASSGGAANSEVSIYQLGQSGQPVSWSVLTSDYGRLLLFLQLTLDGEAEIWLETAADEAALHQDDWNDEELSRLYGRLMELRQLVPALQHGQQRFLNLVNPDVFGLARDTRIGRCTLVLNLSATPQELPIGDLGTWIAGTHELLGSGEVHKSGSILLDPFEGRLYEWHQVASNSNDNSYGLLQ